MPQPHPAPIAPPLTYRNQQSDPTKNRLSKEGVNTTESRLLWSRLRRKQVLGVQFSRQKPIGTYIVDFYAPKVKLVVEVDGSQHLNTDHSRKDAERDAYLGNMGLKVLRFNSRQVLKQTNGVVQAIAETVSLRLK